MERQSYRNKTENTKGTQYYEYMPRQKAGMS